MNCKYCLWCGSALEFQEKDKYLCTGCKKTHYVCPKASAGAFVISGVGENKRIYLSRRGRNPHIGMLDVVGGFLDSHESLEEAVIREFYEETGLDSTKISTLTYIGSDTSLYEWQGDNYPVSATYFVTRIEDPDEMVASDDVEEIVSFKRSELNKDDFAKPGVYQLALKAWDLM